MKKIYIILVAFFGFISNTNGQQIPANKQTKSILILNGFAHLGNGKVIENSAIGFKNGKIILVDDAKTVKLSSGAFDITIDAAGKHIYPGFIAPNSTLGLVEVDAVKSSDDEREIGDISLFQNIGCMNLDTSPIKATLRAEANAWKNQYARNLHASAQAELTTLVDFMKDTISKIERPLVERC